MLLLTPTALLTPSSIPKSAVSNKIVKIEIRTAKCNKYMRSIEVTRPYKRFYNKLKTCVVLFNHSIVYLFKANSQCKQWHMRWSQFEISNSVYITSNIQTRFARRIMTSTTKTVLLFWRIFKLTFSISRIFRKHDDGHFRFLLASTSGMGTNKTE